MNKIILTKAQDVAIRKFTHEHTRDKQQVILGYINNSHGWAAEYKPLADMGFDTFVLALYNDYEIEKDLDERISDILNHYFKDAESYIIKVVSDIMAAIHDHNLVKFLEEGESYAKSPEGSDI